MIGPRSSTRLGLPAATSSSSAGGSAHRPRRCRRSQPAPLCLISAFAALAAALGSADRSSAALQISLIGNTDPVNNKATLKLTYTSISDTAASLVLEVKNNSNGIALITGVAINNPIVGLTGVSLASTTGTLDNSKWGVLLTANGIGTPQPLGEFDLGVLSANNINSGNPFNGGNPQAAIEVGNTGIFTLSLSGTGLDDQTNAYFESAFFNELSAKKDNEDGQSIAAVRFQQTIQGSGNGGSDVGKWDGEPPLDPFNTTDVPELSSLGVWLLGLGAVAGLKWRRGL